MEAAQQLKTLIKSFAEGDDAHFYAVAMQMAAAEARNGNQKLADDLVRTIDQAKSKTHQANGLLKKLPVNGAQKDLNELLDLIKPHVTLSNMILEDSIKQGLVRLIEEQKKIDLLLRHGLAPRRKLLLVGPPGSGKTMSASVIAAELGLTVFVIRLDGLISRYMGESISKLRLIFDSMKQFKAVYLFDEFDSIATSRTDSNDVGEIKRVLNSFLLEIEKDQSDSIIVAATNLPQALDTALLRRFDDIIKFSLPNSPQIVEAFEEGLKVLEHLIYFNLASTVRERAEGLSYDDIFHICAELVKESILYGDSQITKELLVHYIDKRKSPFK
ncbi:ATPase family associated with various cellular activities (AAA) [Chitinophaga sp. CF118]|uniref:AAA family ATPase n=1 Tax=Chitinophaga sp. CF118 TaxID=1884367 RepID=UPI0008F384B2|nr:ATP-binding protein [Chitinophaga sp. CF118]SFE91513.1 ATPase family associated with various cellular activities (AAA) [Chitinophaga sp. CF118]